MHRHGRLNARQGEVLKRIADGDDLANADKGSKRSATALHDRGLVVVRRSPWRTAITEAGRFYLAHGRYPDKQMDLVHALARGPAGQHQAPGAPPTSSASKHKRLPPHATARISAERQTAAVALIEELLAAGEKLIPEPNDQVEAHWRRVVDYTKRTQLVPYGKRIEKTRVRWGRGALRIRLLDGPHPNSRRHTGLVAVPMPSELRELHPVVKALEDDSGRLHMAASLRRRCLLYLHGLTQEAVRRGFGIQTQPVADRHRGRITTYGRPGVPDYSLREGELNIVVQGFSYRITIDQEHPEAEALERYCQLGVWVRGPGQPDGCRTQLARRQALLHR